MLVVRSPPDAPFQRRAPRPARQSVPVFPRGASNKLNKQQDPAPDSRRGCPLSLSYRFKSPQIAGRTVSACKQHGAVALKLKHETLASVQHDFNMWHAIAPDMHSPSSTRLLALKHAAASAPQPASPPPALPSSPSSRPAPSSACQARPEGLAPSTSAP